MNKRVVDLIVLPCFLIACDDSSQSVGEVEAAAVPECVKSSRSIYEEKNSLLPNVLDTVCVYNDYPYADTICCFGSPGTFLRRDDNGQFYELSGDFAFGERTVSLDAAVKQSAIEKCFANVGGEQYMAMSIGEQTWFTENGRGEGRCLYDDEKNCNIFGTLMPYENAKELCSGDFRLPTRVDVKNLMHSVGAEIRETYVKDACGETPRESFYYNIPLFAYTQDTPSENPYGFSFPVDGGTYEKVLDGSAYTYSVRKTCFFLQSDGSSDFVNAFCYDSEKKFAFLTELDEKAELYVRCIMK